MRLIFRCQAAIGMLQFYSNHYVHYTLLGSCLVILSKHFGTRRLKTLEILKLVIP